MYTVRLTEHTDTKPLIAEHFLQSRFWADFKALHGWTYRQYTVTSGTEQSFLLTVLLRLIAPFGSIAYIPMGPSVLTEENSLLPETACRRGNFLTTLADKLVPVLPADVFLLRFDPPWGTEVVKGTAGTQPEAFPLFPTSGKEDQQAQRQRFKLVDPPSDIQPPDTVLLDLTKPLDTLLNECKSKWRYNIRLAEKKGVTVQCFSGGDAEQHGIPLFYELYRETALRDGIAIHSEEYYRSLCRLSNSCIDNPEGIRIAVYGAFFEEESLAAIIMLFSQKQAVYLYGASSNKRRNLMPAYLLQWKAICDAHKADCRSYDFYGIPPSDNPAHPMHGLYRFKTGFGGSIVHRIGSVDIPVKPIRCSLYHNAERLRAFWFKTVKKHFKKHTPAKK